MAHEGQRVRKGDKSSVTKLCDAGALHLAIVAQMQRDLAHFLSRDSHAAEDMTGNSEAWRPAEVDEAPFRRSVGRRPRVRCTPPYGSRIAAGWRHGNHCRRLHGLRRKQENI